MIIELDEQELYRRLRDRFCGGPASPVSMQILSSLAEVLLA